MSFTSHVNKESAQEFGKKVHEMTIERLKAKGCTDPMGDGKTRSHEQMIKDYDHYQMQYQIEANASILILRKQESKLKPIPAEPLKGYREKKNNWQDEAYN